MSKPAFSQCACVFGLILVLFLSELARAQEHEEGGHHGFQDISHWATFFESPERAKWQKPDEVVRALNLKPGLIVVDIGAGTGYFTRRFARSVGPSGEAIGLDIEPGMIAYMQADANKLKLSNYQARLVKPGDPGLDPHSADIIFFCDVLHHIEDRVAYLTKLIPALKSGGRVAVVDFKKTSPINPAVTMRIPRDEMIAQFKAAGYRLGGEHDFLPYQYFLEFQPKSPS